MNSAIINFNLKIKSYLTNDAKDVYSNTVKLMLMLYPRAQDYYTIFDNFTYRMGMTMLAIPVFDDIGEVGYLPKLRYNPDNLFNREVGIEELINSINPISFDNAYICLAKESLYRISEVKDLKIIVSRFQI